MKNASTKVRLIGATVLLLISIINNPLIAQCNTLACNCPGEIISAPGEYISDIGVNSGSDADGLPDNDFTNNISGNDVLTLGFDLGPDEVFGEICVVVGFNNRRGAVTFSYNNEVTEIENPTGLTGRVPQTICLPITGQGQQEIEIQDTGNGNIRVDGSEIFYCSCDPADPTQDCDNDGIANGCLLYTSPSPRDQRGSRMPSSA